MIKVAETFEYTPEPTPCVLAGSIFGLDQYIRIIKKHYHENGNQ
jgi:hypothetical protein